VLLRLSRAALLAVLPAELALAVLLVSGVRLPVPVIVAAEVAVATVVVLEVAAARRLFASARNGGAGRGEAMRSAVRQLVPLRVRRLVMFELRGLMSLLLWAARRRSGVTPGAAELPYAKEQFSTLMALVSVAAVEVAGTEVLLRHVEAPAVLRGVLLVAGGYALLTLLGVMAGFVTRPHVVSDRELRVRSGAFIDLRIPLGTVSAVRAARGPGGSGLVSVEDGVCTVPVASQTNVVVELTQPVTVVRPLGGRAKATTVRFFADAPTAAVAALKSPPAQRPRA
jgi:hypothetical protein